ncbi:unnamed protein product [Psylliodes chrysocephalus]|uniref:Uncharacterized protein n=1 Tax=Psylliodes chrysocephalus TaxID=3402493 RepID=A0A9P0D0Q3_9CUCU|nr:unnamed protein product [Psylliodes chrysocephala]
MFIQRNRGTNHFPNEATSNMREPQFKQNTLPRGDFVLESQLQPPTDNSRVHRVNRVTAANVSYTEITTTDAGDLSVNDASESENQEVLDKSVTSELVEENKSIVLQGIGQSQEREGNNEEGTRKRKRNIPLWKTKVQKKLRMEGKAHTTQTGKPKRKRVVKEVRCRCHYKCNQKITEDQRKTMLENYLKLETKRLRLRNM